MRVPEGIGFTAEDLSSYETVVGSAQTLADECNAKLPALFEAWLKTINLSNRTPETEAILSIMKPLFEAWVKQEGAKVIYVKLPTDFHPQHKQNGMVSTEPVEGWQRYVSLNNTLVVCDGCKVCISIEAKSLSKWLVVTKNISEIGDPKSRFVHREYYCFNCRSAHE